LNTLFNDIYGFVLQNGNVVDITSYYDGSFNQHFMVVAFDSTGVLDSTFAAGGVFIDTTNVNLSGQVVTAKQSDDRMILASQRAPATDGIEIMREYAARPDAVFFIDPPYTAAGKKAGRRLYTHSKLDHGELFRVTRTVAGDFLMTYDDAEGVQELARDTGKVMLPANRNEQVGLALGAK